MGNWAWPRERGKKTLMSRHALLPRRRRLDAVSRTCQALSVRARAATAAAKARAGANARVLKA